MWLKEGEGGKERYIDLPTLFIDRSISFPLVDMTYYSDKGEKPTTGKFLDFDHITFYVGNAKQAADHYSTRIGFTKFGYSGLETGSRNVVSWIVKQNDIVFIFKSALLPGNDGEY
eukprot:sb/3476718/